MLGCELPTCLTPLRSLGSAAAELLGYRFQGSLANFLSPARRVGLFSACVPPVPEAGGVARKRYVHGTKSECPSRADGGGGPTETEVGALMKVLIGVDPHKGSVAVAAIDEATGELLERASFLQDRTGLRRLEHWARRFAERRPKRWRKQGA
jgi:hypothetical protein